MLKQLEVKLAEQWHGFDEYYIFYDDTFMTEAQAEKELEFLDWGMGFNPELYPYYLILPKIKKPLLKSIKEYFLNGAYEEENI
jgi:hypothetical protein